jgi:hypothetical protein
MFSTTPSVCSNCFIVVWSWPVENPPIGHDDDGVEDTPVMRVMERCELVREPGDREALPATGRVLEEVALPCAFESRVRDHLSHRIELLIALKDKKALPGLAALRIFFFDLVDELPHQVEDAVAPPVSSHRYPVA